MKRSLAVVLVSVCMFAGSNVLAEESVSDAAGISINAGGTLIMQGVQSQWWFR